MNNSNNNISLVRINGLILLLFLIFVSVLSWITYATLQGVFGMLAYLLIGFLSLYPWIIPFVGIPLGILESLNLFGVSIYQITLELAHIDDSWMTLMWYWIISIIGILIDLFVSVAVILYFNSLRKKEPIPNSNLALINCKIIDGRSNSSLIEDGAILIQNKVPEAETAGKIYKISQTSKIDIPPDYNIFDLNGKYILPGLINAHCHLTGSGKPMKLMNLSDKKMEFLSQLLDKWLVRKIVKILMKKNCENALNAGVTTLRSMSDPSYVDVELRKEIENGTFFGPRLLVSGKGICITGGHGGPMAYVADSIPEIRKAVRKNLRNEVDCIKILSTGGVMDARKVGEAGRPQMTIEEIETACFEAHRGNLLVATHCESTEGIREALEGGVDTIEHGASIPDELVPKFKNNPKSLRGYTALVPTLSAGMGLSTLPPKITKITPEKYENAKIVEREMIRGLQKAHKTGIKIACGTDASVPYSTHYEVWKELKYYLEYTDMNAQEAIYHATLGTAEVLGIDNITGSIEMGKSADLIVTDENPLENIDTLGKIKHVVVRGKLIKNPKVKKVKKLEKTPIQDLIKL